MEEHARTVADRWAKKRAAAIADGMKPAAFDRHMLDFMRWGGWSEENAQAICKRAQKLSERGLGNENTAESVPRAAAEEPKPNGCHAGL